MGRAILNFDVQWAPQLLDGCVVSSALKAGIRSGD
ncbi:hypothetical protein FOPG_12213 [Fusarium oxysporum f. sp. conglutinans race 2 54008]|uniref:Uncharacterized protein n=1 Tax=Fusarium oxysporum f. sp. conglutinans race 2 54008 TaxID=1089457 RepID=X0HKF0_FUSOX|nr:hypothetical protein FOPG_12213 [Fusarium oxysporum f. sp. conglutinans race 2 54008]